MRCLWLGRGPRSGPLRCTRVFVHDARAFDTPVRTRHDRGTDGARTRYVTAARVRVAYGYSPPSYFFVFTPPLVSSPTLSAPSYPADCSVTNKRTDARHSAVAKTGSLPTTRLYRRLLFFFLICFLCARFPLPPVSNLLCKIALSRSSSRRRLKYGMMPAAYTRAHARVCHLSITPTTDTIQHGNETVTLKRNEI